MRFWNGVAGFSGRPASFGVKPGSLLVAALAAALATAPDPALAANVLHLTWNECGGAPGAASDLSTACTDEVGSQTLFVAFALDQPADSVIALEITVDMQHAASSLPAWWHFEPGGCRGPVLDASADFTGFDGCADFWGAQATKDPPVTFLVGQPGNLPSRARIFIGIALAPDQPMRLEAGVRYYAVRLTIPNAGTSACAGCSGAACLVLNSILVGRLTGAPGGNLLVATPGQPETWATWQGGTGSDCNAVPVVRTTWGRIKSLYR